MRKLGFAVGVAALCCLTVSAGMTEIRYDGVTYASTSPMQTLQGQAEQVRGFLGNVHMGPTLANRAVETVYDNTDTNSVGGSGEVCSLTYGFAPTVCHEFGDVLLLTKKGDIDNFEIAIYNSSGSAVDMCSVDIVVRLYDAGLTQFATIDLGTVTLDDVGCLGPGYWIGLTVSGLNPVVGTGGCTMTITQQYANTTSQGGAAGPTNAGLVFGFIPVVGDSNRGGFAYNGNCGEAIATNWWFGDPTNPANPCSNMYYRVDADNAVECPPPLYDNTTGGGLYGLDEVEGSWIGDDITYEFYGSPPTPPALNNGLLDIFKMTFWNWNTDEIHPSDILGADLEVCFFDRSDPSTCVGTFGTTLDYSTNPLARSYYRTIIFTGLAAAKTPVPIYGGLAGVKVRASNVMWSTHNTTHGSPGQIVFQFTELDPVEVGDSDGKIFFLDPAPEFGGDDGWYTLGDPTTNPANLFYYIEVTNWAVGDMNCDGSVDLFDIDPFVLALTSAGHTPAFDDYYAAYPNCNPLNGDADGNGTVDLFDIDPFVGILTGK